MKKLILLLLAIGGLCWFPSAQSVAINTDGSTAHSSAILDVKSSNKGILISRMSSSERKSIAAPAKGLLVFDNDLASFMYWDGAAWQLLTPGNSSLGVKKETSAPAAENTLRFGYRLAMAGNYAAISAYTKDDPFGEKVFIYQKNSNGQWQQVQKLTSPEAQSNGHFGFSLDIDGDYLVVSAPFKTDNGIARAAVYVYRRQDNNWALDATLQLNHNQNYSFGFDVAVSATTPQGVVVAASMPYAKGLLSNQYNAGKIILFRKSGTTWQATQTISSLQFKQNDKTGFSVDIDGDLLAFGAPYHNNSGGSVYIYRFSATTNTWEQEYSLSGSENSGFGYAVSISNGVVAAGAPRLDYSNVYKGYATIIYKSPDNGWRQSSIRPPAGFYNEGYARFGASVQLDGNNLLVGGCGTITQTDGQQRTGYQPGKAALYQIRFQNNQNWFAYSLRQQFQAEFTRNEDEFGRAVAISGNSFFISNEQACTATNYLVGSVLIGSLD